MTQNITDWEGYVGNIFDLIRVIIVDSVAPNGDTESTACNVGPVGNTYIRNQHYKRLNVNQFCFELREHFNCLGAVEMQERKTRIGKA